MKFGFGSSPEKNGIPHIERVAPAAAIPGGEMTIHGRGFVSRVQPRPVVRFGDAEASIALASENRLVARVPEGASGGIVRVSAVLGQVRNVVDRCVTGREVHECRDPGQVHNRLMEMTTSLCSVGRHA